MHPASPSPSDAPLRALVRSYPSVLLGYSGGVDSAFLAVVLRQELGRDRMLAVIGRSPSYPEAQWRTARAVTERFDIPLLEIDTHELEDANYLANPTNRCFYCKQELWGRLMPLAREHGLEVVCDGTNADDLGEHRPVRVQKHPVKAHAQDAVAHARREHARGIAGEDERDRPSEALLKMMREGLPGMAEEKVQLQVRGKRCHRF